MTKNYDPYMLEYILQRQNKMLKNANREQAIREMRAGKSGGRRRRSSKRVRAGGRHTVSRPLRRGDVTGAEKAL